MRQRLVLKENQIDHLLQLLNPIELQGVLEKVIVKIANKREFRYLLDIVKANIENTNPKIVLKTTKQHYILRINDIIHLEADGAYTSFYTTSQKIVVSKNIMHYQNLLDDTFVRCHQSHLVNSKHVLGINQKGQLQLTNDGLVPISTRNRTKIVKLIKGFNTLRKVS